MGTNLKGTTMESGSYPVSQMITDIVSVMRDSAIYLIPAAIIVAVVAFILAWFMDSVDIAGRTFGRHR